MIHVYEISLCYHKPDDPTERHNLADDPAHAHKVQEMKQFVLAQFQQYRQAPDENLVFADPAGNPTLFGGVWATGWCEHMNILNDNICDNSEFPCGVDLPKYNETCPL